MDERLVGLWAESVLYPSDVESADLAFRADGSGWLHWSSWSTSFTVSRYTWASTRPGRLTLKFHRVLDGTWSIDDGVTRHDVESEEPDDTNIEVATRSGPARIRSASSGTSSSAHGSITGLAVKRGTG